MILSFLSAVLYLFAKVGYDSRIFVSHKKVINMPADCHLFSIDGLICNAWIVRVDFISQWFEISNQFLIKEESTFIMPYTAFSNWTYKIGFPFCENAS